MLQKISLLEAQDTYNLHTGENLIPAVLSKLQQYLADALTGT